MSRKQASRGSQRAPLPFWVWLLMGVVLGAGLASYFILREGLAVRGPQPNPQAQAAPEGDKPLVELAAGDSRAQNEADAKKPRYDFYSVLPEMEVVIPDAELEAQSQQPAAASTPPAAGTPPAATPAPAQRLFLQVASFGNSGDAEAVKARLALLGVQAQVVPVTINGGTWHRVRVGPYSDARALEAAKRELAANNFEAIALRER